ncbi:hypothetical protein G7046_g8781 [Stylonectria norvegica]|nr:hypothetical protein G7046_g8781 [Stylonectria norvegica]
MAPSKSRKRKSDQDLLTTTEVAAPAAAELKRQKKLPVREKGENEPKGAGRPSAPTQGALKVFGDDDEIEEPAKILKPAAPVEEEGDEEDSDDDAPEAVSTNQVASEIKKSAQAAQKVAQEQAIAQKRKRQQRDALFKQQADERKKADAETKAAADALLAQEEAASGFRQGEGNGRKRRTDKVEIPNLLPAEFLTDSSSDDEDEDEDISAPARPKKRKISTIESTLSRQDRGPRDTRVGSTVYRVAKKVDERLAPKLRKHARSSKELLLKRNRSSVTTRSGFFVK